MTVIYLIISYLFNGDNNSYHLHGEDYLTQVCVFTPLWLVWLLLSWRQRKNAQATCHQVRDLGTRCNEVKSEVWFLVEGQTGILKLRGNVHLQLQAGLFAVQPTFLQVLTQTLYTHGPGNSAMNIILSFMPPNLPRQWVQFYTKPTAWQRPGIKLHPDKLKVRRDIGGQATREIPSHK